MEDRTKLIEGVEKFMAAWSELRADYFSKLMYASGNRPLEVSYGKKYAKVTDSRSVLAFIEISNGDIYKAADWRSPAKHVRGNVFSDKNGMEAVDGPYSIRYLR